MHTDSHVHAQARKCLDLAREAWDLLTSLANPPSCLPRPHLEPDGCSTEATSTGCCLRAAQLSKAVSGRDAPPTEEGCIRVMARARLQG